MEEDYLVQRERNRTGQHGGELAPIPEDEGSQPGTAAGTQPLEVGPEQQQMLRCDLVLSRIFSA